jgi:hypothetical protein
MYFKDNFSIRKAVHSVKCPQVLQIKSMGFLPCGKEVCLATPHPFSDFVTLPSHNFSINFSCFSDIIKWNFNLHNFCRLNLQLSSHSAMPRTAWSRYLVVNKFIMSIENCTFSGHLHCYEFIMVKKTVLLLERLTAYKLYRICESQGRGKILSP